jgi:hypothetical protein
MRALREQGFERYRLGDQSLLVHVAHEGLERVPIALEPVGPEVLTHRVHGLVGVLDEERQTNWLRGRAVRAGALMNV